MSKRSSDASAKGAGGGRGGSQNITVAVRVRPLSSKEETKGSHACLVVQDGKQINCNDPDGAPPPLAAGHTATCVRTAPRALLALQL